VEPSEEQSEGFSLGDWQVRPALGQISNGERELRLEPRVMQLLSILAEANGQLVTRNELFDQIWPNQIISDQTLSSLISQLRRHLGDSPRNPTLIETVPKKGYRLLQSAVSFNQIAVAKQDNQDTENRTRRHWPKYTVAALFSVGAIAVWQLLTQQIDNADRRPVPDLAEGSIAVLPFADMTRDASTAYFGDGIAEELLNQLANVPGLQVVSRTSSFQYRERDGAVDIREIGSKLNAAHVVEGSVRRDGDQVRVTVQLIDASSGYHRWSQVFEDRWTDLFHLQDSITEAVVQQIAPQLAVTDSSRGSANNTAAYDLYLQGRHLWHQRNPSALNQAIERFERAIELDPGFAPAYAGLADSYISQPRYGTLSASESIALAEPLIDQIFSLAPNSAEALRVRGNWHALQTSWAHAETDFRRALERNPNSAMTQMALGSVYNDSGRLDQAYLHYQQALQLNPLHPTIAMNLAQTAAKLGLNKRAKMHVAQARSIAPNHIYLFGLTGHIDLSAGDARAADQTLTQWLEQQRGNEFSPEPSVVTDYVMCGILSLFLDRPELARQCLTTAIGAAEQILPPYEMQALTHLAFMQLQAGQSDEAQQLARRALEVGLSSLKDHPAEEVIVYEQAVAHALLGNTNQALEALARSIDLGRRDLGRMRSDRRIASLGTNPKFQSLIHQVEQEQTALRIKIESQLDLESINQ